MTLKHFDVATWEFDQAEANQDTLPVFMDDSRQIEVSLGQEARIATSGLRGCTAVASTVQLQSGDRVAYLQHYQPRMHTDGLEKLSAYYASLLERDIDPSTLQTVIMRPEPAGTSDSIRHSMAGKWLDAGRIIAGTSDFAQVIPYHVKIERVAAGTGTLLIDIQANGEATIFAELMPVNFAK